MAQTRLNITLNGQEVQISDLNAVAQVAAQADDYALGELFRLEPDGYVQGGGTIAKAILPWGLRNANGELTGGIAGHSTVAPAGATGSVSILPFRAMVGTRTVVAGGASNQLNWQDIRSQAYIGTNASNNLTQVALSANASGNPRWDLVYCAVVVDGATTNVTRFIKSPTTKVVSQQSISVSLSTTAAIGVVAGTPGASPALPTLPVDGGGIYNIPLAYVWVPNGFGAGSTVSLSNIRDASPTAQIARSTGASSLRPANGNNDGAGTYQSDSTFAWNTLGGVRSPVFIPPSMMGGEQLIVEIDALVQAHPSHANGSIVDSSTDWRNRFFIVLAQWHTSLKFGNDTTSTVNTATLPNVLLSTSANLLWFASNSLQVDGALVNNDATVALIVVTGNDLGLYVDPSTGAMKCFISATTPAVRAFFWVFASAPFPNR
jgi:hypothetical protein